MPSLRGGDADAAVAPQCGNRPSLAKTICSILVPMDWNRSRWSSSKSGVAVRSINVSTLVDALSTSAVRYWAVLVEFTVHSGDEILRDGEWAADWTAAEASVDTRATLA